MRLTSLKNSGLFIFFVSLLGLVACADTNRIPSQYWQGIQVYLETRPSPIRLGMNEFLVSTTLPVRRAVYDLVVSIRSKETAPWVQSIQDGHTGIYRRALSIEGAGPHYLWVRIERGGERVVLRFSLGSALSSE